MDENGYKTSEDIGDLTIKIDLDKFIKGNFNVDLLDAFEDGLDHGLDEFEVRLSDKLNDNLASFELDTSNMAQTVYSNRTSNGVEIGVGADYGIYVEYGTGIKGSENPHPAPELADWEYEIGSHINPDTHIWRYPKGYTKGQGARPFIYRTMQWGKRSVYNIVRKHIRKELKKVGGKL